MKKQNDRERDAQAGTKAPGDTEYAFRLPFPMPQTMMNLPLIAVASDEKIYAADVESGVGSTLFVARTTRDGDPDESFGRDGWTTEYIEIDSGIVTGLLRREDGGVLVAVKHSVNTYLEIALVCFAADGELDPTFGEGGKIVHRLPVPASPGETGSPDSDSDVGQGGQLAGSGVAIGAAEDGTFYCLLGSLEGPFYALIRFQPDGRLDTGFNGTGFVTDGEWFYRAWGASSIVVAADGRVTVTGLIYSLNAVPLRRLAAWRFNPDGTLDRSFGDDGYAFFDADAMDLDPGTLHVTHFSHAAGLPNDGIAICGYATTRSEATYQRYGLLACLDSSGKPLATFNRGKFRLFGLVGDYETEFRGGLGVQGDGRIVVGGRVTDDQRDSELLVGRFEPSGMVDTTFAQGGTKRFRPDNVRVNFMSNLCIDSNGKILVAARGGPNDNVSSMSSFVFQLSGR